MRVLEGIAVLDLSTQMPGPYCSMLLADLGAEVVKVEAPGGDPLRAYPPMFDSVNRGKRSIALDLKRAEGRAVLARLVERTDLVLEGFRPGVAARLGVDYPSLATFKPDIIYCAISGFGQDGPYRDRSGHDINYLAMGGVLGLEVPIAGKPSPPPVLVSDLAAGQFAAIGLLAALVGRLRTGTGQYIDLSMTDGVVSWVGTELARFHAEGVSPDRPNVTVAPHYEIFATADGGFVALGIVYEDHFWRHFCDLMALPAWRDWKNDERLRRYAEIRAELRRCFLGRPRREWQEIFDAADVPFAGVATLGEVLENPQFGHRGLFAEAPSSTGRGTSRQVAIPMKFSRAECAPRGAPPRLSEHAEPILKDLGYSSDAIRGLAGAGAVVLPKEQVP
jgi:crotonobetainyl-CoA:carnitine CoA-transferase CaiB-like acyl-CoA transferase